MHLTYQHYYHYFKHKISFRKRIREKWKETISNFGLDNNLTSSSDKEIMNALTNADQNDKCNNNNEKSRI